MFFSERSQNSSLGVCTGTLLAQNTSCMHFIQWSKSLTYWRRLLLCVALYVPGAGSDSHSNTHRHTADLQKSDGSESAEARMSLVGLGGTVFASDLQRWKFNPHLCPVCFEGFHRVLWFPSGFWTRSSESPALHPEFLR